ncbi:MAG: efflux RND transporter periplasmic adaptor subunit [Pseudomonadota bacterium]
MAATRVLGCLVLALSLLAGPALAQRGPAGVVVAPVLDREIADTAPVIARLVGTVDSQVATRTAGVVAEVHFEIGARVGAGAPLVTLDDQLFRIQAGNAEAALRAALAAVEVAQARSRLSQQALERAAGLQGSVAFSRGSFEDLQQQAAEAASEITRAEAQVGVAEAALERARYDLRHGTILAPFEGVVIERMAQPGQYIDLGAAVARLLDVRRLEIEADVPVDLVGGLSRGRELDAIFDGGFEARATVRSLLPVEVTSTRTRTVRFAVGQDGLPESLGAIGRAVTLRVPISAPRTAPVVPKDALVQKSGGWIVFVAADGVAEPRTVGLGQSAGEFMEVTSGVTSGEHVVVRGNERLRPGQPIAPRLVDGTPLDEAPTAAEGAPQTETDDREGSVEAAPAADSTARAEAPRVPAGSAAAATAD